MFKVDQFRNLVAEIDGERDIIFTVRGFMSNDNANKAAGWFRSLAVELNEMEPFSDEMAKKLEEAEAKLENAKLAEKCLEEISF